MIEIKTVWNKWQWKFLMSQAKHRALFAEFRSGKTKAAGADLFKHLSEYPGTRAAVIRNIHQELIDSTIPQLKEVHDWDVTGEKFNKSTKILELNNGSIIECFALDRPDDVKKLKNVALGYVMLDQGEEIHPDIYDMALGRMSQKNAPNRSVVIGNFEGKGWYWDKFYAQPVEVETGTFKGKQRDFGIYRGQDENFIGFWPPPFLNVKNLPDGYYDEQIKNHSQDWNDKYMWGLPTGNAGLIHKDYNEQRHLIRAENYFTIPPRQEHAWSIYEGMDYGVSNPTCWLFVAYSREDDTIYFLDEYYQSGENIYFHGPKIKKFREEYGRPIWTIGCPRAFQTERDSKCPSDEYASKYNISLIQYPVGIEARIEVVNRRFKLNKIKIFDRCQFLKRQIEGTTWKNMENTENHALEPFHRIVAKIDAESNSSKMRDILKAEPSKKIEQPVSAGIMSMDF